MKNGFAPTDSAMCVTMRTASSSALWPGMMQYVAFWNRSASAATGPDSSLPAIGCPPTKLTVSGRNSSAHVSTSAFVLPVSVTMTPGSSSGPYSLSISRMPPTGVARMTMRDPRMASSGLFCVESQAPILRAVPDTARSRSVPTISNPRSAFLRASPRDVPISPMPTMVILSTPGLLAPADNSRLAADDARCPDPR